MTSDPPIALESATTDGFTPPGASPAGREIELKLLLQPNQVLPVHREASRIAVGARGQSRQLRSIYFDTEARDLLDRGLALRVRKSGRVFIQTIKQTATVTAGLFDRVEQEDEVVDLSPDLGCINNAQLRAHLEGIVGDRPLESFVETQVMRTQYDAMFSGSRVELALDVGSIRTNRGIVPICELELELRSGEAIHLFDLALALLDAVPMRVGNRSKFDQAVALANGSRPVAMRAELPRIDPKATAGDAFRIVLQSGLDQILGNEAAASEGVDPEGVHQLRIGVRRVRAAFWLFRDVAGSERRSLIAELRWLAGELGPARDFDVFLGETLQGLGPSAASVPIERLRSEAASAWAEHLDQVREALDSPRYARLVLRLGRLLLVGGDGPKRDESARELTRRRLSGRLRKIVKVGRRVDWDVPSERHALRVALKPFRYGIEFSRELHRRGDSARYERELRKLLGTLGRLNDFTVAEQRIGELRARLAEPSLEFEQAAGFLEGFLARSGEADRAGLSRRWRRFARRRPPWSKK